MKNFSFRLKIIGTIILVVSLLSIISFTFFNIILSNRLLTHTQETFNQINLVRNQYYFTISQHDGRIIKSMLKNLENDKYVLRTYLVNSNLKVTYPTDYSALHKDTARLAGLFSQKKDISILNYNDEVVPFSRVFIRLQNNPSCYSCHNPVTEKNIGMIVMDLANHETKEIVLFTRQFSIYYTLFILLAIFTLVAYLHYKYIRKSLKQFRSTITQVNQGNLSVRLDIPIVRELGNLGRDFNEMMNTFEKTQKELKSYHQKELKNSQKLATIGEMSARVAHEIRNPIMGIVRAMEIINAEMKDSNNKPILEEIQRQANRVNQAISNMLKFSKSKDLFLQEGDINDVIRSQVFFLKNQAHDKTINFEMDLSEDLPTLSFDHELIENVLLNLSLNAIQSINESGMIIYKTEYHSEQKKIIISVIDNGSGIPLTIGDEIFKPFYTTSTKGTGLGLAISKDIVEKHSGELWFENNTDSGCSFYISLPLKY